jgi:hypothetical protein
MVIIPMVIIYSTAKDEAVGGAIAVVSGVAGRVSRDP